MTDAERSRELAWAGRTVVRAGLVIGSGGNLSVRAADGETCLVSRAGAWLDDLDAADLSTVRIGDGVVLAGHPHPSSEVQLHLHAYRTRPDIAAVLHVHPQTSALLTALGQPIRPTTTDHVFYLGRIAVVPFLRPGGEAVARAAAAAVTAPETHCVMLNLHGCVVVAESLELAVKRALNLEEAARTTYSALLLGAELPPAPAELLDWAREAGSA